MKNKTKTGEWVLYWILVALTCLGFATSCTPEPLIIDYSEYLIDNNERFTPKAFIVKNKEYQEVYIDSLESDTYFTIYAEANKMPERYRYNGEYNIWASFSTPNSYNDGTNTNYIDNVPYVSTNSVRFDRPRVFNGKVQGYQPKKLDLYTKQTVGPIHKTAVKRRDTISIYMDVSFDDEYFVRDTLFVVLRPK
jgi:hypothetical protein